MILDPFKNEIKVYTGFSFKLLFKFFDSLHFQGVITLGFRLGRPIGEPVGGAQGWPRGSPAGGGLALGKLE